MATAELGRHEVLGFATASPQEQAGLIALTERERKWYAFARRYETDRAIGDAVLRGEIVHVPSNSNVVPIMRFRNPQLQGIYPPYLTPRALAAYVAVGRLWRKELIEQEIDDERYRLASTSFVRSQAAQDEIVRKSDKLAVPDSTHCCGDAFDLDTSGYHFWSETETDAVILKVSHPLRDMTVAAMIGQTLGVDRPTGIAVDAPYDQAVMDVLKYVLTGLHEDGAINYVPEFVGTANECSHIAPNPALDENDWAHII